MSTDNEHDAHDGNAVKTSPIDSSPSKKSERVASVSRTVLNTRRKGVRKANSSGSIPSSSKTTRRSAIERSRSASNAKFLSPNPQKLRSKFTTRFKTDASIDTTSTPTSEEGSTGSYSLESSDKSSDSIVKSEIARINSMPDREPVSPSSMARIISRESIDPLDQKQRRTGLRRNGSRSSEICEQLDIAPIPHSRGIRRSGSRSSDISEQTDIAPSPHSRSSPYVRGRKKLPSELPIDESYRSTTSASVRTRSSKQSSTPKVDDAIEGTSNHSDRRKTRSKTRKSGGSSGSSGKQRSSSKKSVKNGEKSKRHSRRSRTPSSKKEPTPSNSDSSADRENCKVTEEEILQLLDETQQKSTLVKRKSKSPAPESLDASYREKRPTGKHRVQQRRRSISSGAFETTRTTRRHSNEGPNSVTKEKKTRRPPGRTRSNNVGVDSSGLDSFLKQGSGSRRRKASNRSVLSGSKSVGVSGSRTVYSTNSAGNRPRRRHLKSSNSLRSDISPRRPSRFARPKFSDGEEPIFEINDDEDSDDDDSLVKMDLDLATARDKFKQQSLNEKLQMHLTKTDELLYSVFPKHIADALRNGQKVAPENHDLVTIFFSDIVGFTDISAKLDPLKISEMLDRLYNSFDALSDYHDVFKVETIGDAYMAVTNLTKEQPDHCKRITEFAVDAIRVANQTLIDEDNPSMGFVNIRVGFHSGSVVSNVVGTRNPRYCLFGDTVNTASRMESNSEKNRINCSETSASLLRKQSPRVRIFPRGSIDVKGKGEMNTFWVHTEGSFQTRQRNKGTFSNFMEKVRKR